MRSSYWTIMVAVLIAEIAAIFETSMIYVALPTLMREFGDPITAGWLITSHALIGTSAALMAGRLGDIYGRKRVLLVMLSVAVVGSVLSAVTSNFGLVLFGRALQGMASALIPLSIGIIRENIEKERLNVAIGLITTGQGMGTATGLVLGGWLIDNYEWHMLFAVSAVMLSVAWIVIRLMIPDKPGNPPTNPIDWFEGILPVPGLTAVLLGISLSNSRGWLDATVIGLVLLGLAIMAYWARRSLSAVEPFINLRLLMRRNIGVAVAIAVFLSMGTMQITIVVSAYMQNPLWTAAGLGLSATIAGLSKLPSNVLAFTAGPFSGWLMQKRGMRLPIVVGGTLAVIGWLLMLSFPSTVTQIVLLLCVATFGTTMLNAIYPMVIVASVPPSHTSEAIGALSVLRGMAQSIGSQVIAVLLAVQAVSQVAGGPRMPSATSFQVAITWIIGLTIVATLCAFLLRANPEDTKEPAPAE